MCALIVIIEKVCMLVPVGEKLHILQEQFSKCVKSTDTFVWGFPFLIHFLVLLLTMKSAFSEYTRINCTFLFAVSRNKASASTKPRKNELHSQVLGQRTKTLAAFCH